jgi:hypothetical protein
LKWRESSRKAVCVPLVPDLARNLKRLNNRNLFRKLLRRIQKDFRKGLE